MPFPDWSGENVAVIAGGQSASRFASALRGACRVIVVNLAYRLIPEADVLYVGDSGFWTVYQDAKDFNGLILVPKHCAGISCPSALPIVELSHMSDFVEGPVGCVGTGGGNSGFQALNLAVQFKPRHLFLTGFDYRGLHWHEQHPSPLQNPNRRQFERWRGCFDRALVAIRAMGIPITHLV